MTINVLNILKALFIAFENDRKCGKAKSHVLCTWYRMDTEIFIKKSMESHLGKKQTKQKNKTVSLSLAPSLSSFSLLSLCLLLVFCLPGWNIPSCSLHLPRPIFLYPFIPLLRSSSLAQALLMTARWRSDSADLQNFVCVCVDEVGVRGSDGGHDITPIRPDWAAALGHSIWL